MGDCTASELGPAYLAAAERGEWVEMVGLELQAEDVKELKNWQDREGRTALMMAAKSGQIAAVLYALRDGDVNMKDKQGRSAINYALENGHKSLVPALTLARRRSR